MTSKHLQNRSLNSNVAEDIQYLPSGRISINSLTMQQKIELEDAFQATSRLGGLKKAKLAVKLGGNVHDIAIIHLWFAVRRRLEVLFVLKLHTTFDESSKISRRRRSSLIFKTKQLHFPFNIVDKIYRQELGMCLEPSEAEEQWEIEDAEIELWRWKEKLHAIHQRDSFWSRDRLSIPAFKCESKIRRAKANLVKCKKKWADLRARYQEMTAGMGQTSDHTTNEPKQISQHISQQDVFSQDASDKNFDKKNPMVPMGSRPMSPRRSQGSMSKRFSELANGLSGSPGDELSPPEYSNLFKKTKHELGGTEIDDISSFESDILINSHMHSIPTINVQLITPETSPGDYENIASVSPQPWCMFLDAVSNSDNFNNGSIDSSSLHIDTNTLTTERRKSIEKVTEWISQNPESPISPGVIQEPTELDSSSTSPNHQKDSRPAKAKHDPFINVSTSFEQFDMQLESSSHLFSEPSSPKSPGPFRCTNPESTLSPHYNFPRSGMKGSKDQEDQSLQSESELFDESLYSVWSDSTLSCVDLSRFLSQSALKKLSMQFMRQFSTYKRKHNIRNCTASPSSTTNSNPTSNPNSTCHNLNKKTGAGKRAGGGKRKRADGDDGDDKRRGHRRSSSSQSKPDTTDYKMERTFACPFCKWKPLTYSNCRAYTLKEISRVKMHLDRVHQVPIHCDRCYKVFKSEEERRVHNRTVNCMILPERTIEGMSGDMAKLVHRRVDARKTKPDQWYDIFKILFPGEPLPESPYIDEVLSRELLALQDFMMQEWSQVSDRLIAQHLPAPLQGQGPLVRHFSNFLFEHAVDDIFQRFESTRRLNTRSPDSGYLDAPQPVVMPGTDVGVGVGEMAVRQDLSLIVSTTTSQIDNVSGTYAGSIPDPNGSGQMSPYTTPSVQLGDAPTTEWPPFIPLDGSNNFLDDSWVPPKFL